MKKTDRFAALGAKGGLARAQKIREGLLPANVGGGRPKKPSHCLKCGWLCASAREAKAHKCKGENDHVES